MLMLYCGFDMLIMTKHTVTFLRDQPFPAKENIESSPPHHKTGGTAEGARHNSQGAENHAFNTVKP